MKSGRQNISRMRRWLITLSQCRSRFIVGGMTTAPISVSKALPFPSAFAVVLRFEDHVFPCGMSIKLFKTVLFATACLASDDDMEMRADGSDFLLRLPAVAGITYNFDTSLRSGSAAHMRLAIFPPDSIGTASRSTGGSDVQDDCTVEQPHGGAADDVADIELGDFPGPGNGRQTWGELNNCDDPTRAGPPGEECGEQNTDFPACFLCHPSSLETMPFIAVCP